MFDKRHLLGGFLGGVGLGLLLITSSTVSDTLRDFGEGLFGVTAQTDSSPVPVAELKANQASISLTAPLKLEQKAELLQGLVLFLNDQYRDAAPILGRYALLGDQQAQSAIGAMFYFGSVA